MRTWRITGVGEPAQVLTRDEIDLAPPGPGELVVDVAAAGLGFPDVLMCRGVYPLAPPVPFTPGQEFVGRVSAVGPGVTVAVGTRLMGVAAFMNGTGSFADRCKTYEPMAFPVPDGMPDEAAASFTIAFHTGYIALVRRAALKAGEVLLVHGASGGTGFAAVQLGKALGARVIATAGGPEKAAECRALGADVVIDHRAEDFVARVRDETGGRGADVVYDPVGGEMFERSFECVAREARLLPIGFACGRWGVVPHQPLVLNQVSVVGALGGGYDRETMLGFHDALLDLYRTGAIKPLIDRRLGFEEIGAGVQALADRKVKGRAVAIY